MRRIGLLVGTALMMGTLALTAQQPPAYKDASLPIERRVADLLSRMTLEEKVAQTLAVWQQKRQLVDANGAFDPAKAGSVLQYGIGQITRPSDGVDRGGKRRNAPGNGRTRQRDSAMGHRAHAAGHPGNVPRGGAPRSRGGERHELSRADRARQARGIPRSSSACSRRGAGGARARRAAGALARR